MLDRNTQKKLGCVLFRDKASLSNGIASIGGNKPFVVSRVGELESDILWLSNLSRAELHRFGLQSNNKIKAYDYLGVDLFKLSNELDLDIEGSPAFAATTLAEVGDRVIRLADKYYDLKFDEKTIKSDLQTKMLTPSDDLLSYGSPIVDRALNQAYQSYQPCYGKRPDNGKLIQFRFSRSFYSKLMLGFPVPQGKWKMLDHDQFPRKRNTDSKTIYQYLTSLGDEIPALINLTVLEIDKNIEGLVGLSNDKHERNWFPVHEAAQLAAYGKIHIKNVLVAEKYIYPELIDRWAIPFGGKTSALSLSFGILLENHWLALSSQQSVVSKTLGKVTSPRSSWIRSWDRLLCLSAANSFKKKGFHVYSYGKGTVNLMLAPSEVQKSLETSMNLQMIAPLWAKKIAIKHKYPTRKPGIVV